jgi:hypothetical protein
MAARWLSGVRCTPRHDGSVEVRGLDGQHDVRFLLDAPEWRRVAEAVVFFGALDVDARRLVAWMDGVEAVVGDPAALRAHLDQGRVLLLPDEPTRDHWVGCVLGPDHAGDCLVPRRRASAPVEVPASAQPGLFPGRRLAAGR